MALKPTPPQSLPLEVYETWVPVRRAVELQGNISIMASAGVLYDRINNGYLKTAGRLAGPHGPTVLIPLEWWGHNSMDVSYEGHFWLSGDASFGEGGEAEYYFSGVRLDPTGVSDLFPSNQPQQLPGRGKGGRPPKPWWDELWVETFRAIYVGDFKPGSMSQIADFMLQWATDNGHELSESAAKRAARKLWPVVGPGGS